MTAFDIMRAVVLAFGWLMAVTAVIGLLALVLL